MVMKVLVAVDSTPEKTSLVYSGPEGIEVYEFMHGDPELPNKIKPYLNEPLFRAHLKRFPLKGVKVE
jgi:hypothetical protein